MNCVDKSLVSVISQEFPEEHFQIPFHIRLSRTTHQQFDNDLLELLALLRRHHVQCSVETCSNGLNAVTILLDKYVLIRPNHTYENWGYQHQALAEILTEWDVWFFHPTKPISFALGSNMTISDQYEVDDGGC